MSLKEAGRYAVIVQVIERTMPQADAAAWLNVSVRQIKRLVRRMRQDGPKGAVLKRWGVPSNVGAGRRDLWEPQCAGVGRALIL